MWAVRTHCLIDDDFETGERLIEGNIYLDGDIVRVTSEQRLILLQKDVSCNIAGGGNLQPIDLLRVNIGYCE